ncbi:TPA: hypothetical protein QDC51_000979 [Burkholderia multivorans]|uniref:hypothetical protein n=1 Tax=Burkholderia multivorans TaxID=87883 RepID=UPI001C24FD49|nr:hypothetical protein [Burkholderia multivorans]MBU9351610.1 hypothetical protein [Burkholderia multivorans]MBU9395035.1 hypothetical protein [Burkholderia multivorans]HDR9834228.1 hypothetical protein [Burkholderia multivorans]HDR9840113.1 hypothetical protein [Burkholderia multivorans]HDR9846701.1 hypothetical protein [Burkholderia multivorans]
MNRTLVAAALACTALAGCYYPYGYYAAAPVQPAPAYAPAWGGYWGPALSLNFGFGGGRGGWRHH